MFQIEGSQGSRQKALDLDPEKIAIRSILGSARPRPTQVALKKVTISVNMEMVCCACEIEAKHQA